MNIFQNLRQSHSTLLLSTCAAAVTACGGGGSSGGASGISPTVLSATTGTAKYGQSLTLTLTGSNLDQGLTVSATGCKGVLPGTLAAGESASTTARYQCTVSAVGTGQFVVTRAIDGASLTTASFNAPAPQVTMTLSNQGAVGGTIVIALSPDKTPVTVDNFLAYVNAGFYNGTVIHRVSPGFVIQGGGYVAPLDANTQTLKPANAPIALEVGKGLSNTQWTIAMARSTDPASATSQFFINLADNSGSLDPGLTAGYAVFGSIASGMGNITSVVGAPCVAIPLFLATGECTPIPNVVVTSAVQSQ